jgi:quercetin dioxygenase-like cupin family protein
MHPARKWSLVGGALAVALVSFVALAQAPGIKRTLLQRTDLQGQEPKECVLGAAEIPPGGSAGKHFHHGIEMGYVAEGESEILVDGEAPKRVKAGESYLIPAQRPHDARNTGSGPVKVIATYVVEKGKPLAEPVK